MYRSYFFALFACIIFSAAALVNACAALPSQVPDGRAAGDTVQAQKPIPPAAGEKTANFDSASRQEKAPASSGEPIGAQKIGESSPGLSQEVTVPLRKFPPVSGPVYGSNTQPDKEASSREIIPLNHGTDNFNILMLGVNKDELEMVSVYSINPDLDPQPKSVSLFFPVNSLLTYKGKKKTLDSIFASGGWSAIAEVVEKEMYIDINYYVKIDRQALRDLEKYFEPIYVDGEKVDIETIFVRRTSNEDDRIIARILRQVLRPEVFFKCIPRLVFSINKDIESNFSFTPSNLLFQYRLARKLSTRRVEKVVLFGHTEWQDGMLVNIPPEEGMRCAIYHATR